ncbi:MAG TPA: S8 family peptidase [Stackebrandtia sp.]|jgi:subtilisin family serine protease|uniref:S8 family peptidase n=1 Tax=Stackebrandtia sp. TaxID=2023065 RepID=UPI002D526872|nr:S8 family peptidase [Stackebrandtia sp.]HZE37680.1 S8 family peptidase [Stackebrandtia sp.]
MRPHRTRFFAACAVATATALGAFTVGTTAAHAESTILGEGSSHAISGSYIVTTNDHMSTSSFKDLLGSYGGSQKHTFKSIDGFAVHATADEARQLAADPAVKYVQQDQKVHLAATQDNPPSWGLDRIDQKDLPLDNSYTYPDTAGSGVTAYIIDTGITMNHPDFGGRASSGTDTVDNDSDATDCHGHGTHVSGTIAGTTYGIAKKAKLVGVRVLDCSGSGSDTGVIAGIDWVTAHHSGPSVANMSLGGGFDQGINDAVTRAIDSGVTFAVAAGNDDADACEGSPSSTPEAITVGATDDTDTRAYFSDYGTCVDIFAPGVDITSDWLNGGTNTISGTSMATPHVVGSAALYLGEHPSAAPSEVASALVDNATANVSDPGAGSPNKLLYTGFMNGGGTEPPGGDCAAASSTSMTIGDLSTINSPVSVSSCGRDAKSTASVKVDITHSYRGDLRIQLVAPSGTVYTLKSPNAWDSANDVKTTYTVNLSSQAADGTWKLRVSDVYSGDSGKLNSWSLAL